jgi:hypothetical protein
MIDPPTLSLAEAAVFLRLGLKSTRKLFDAGELPGVSLNQKHVVFLRSDLERYLREKAIEQSLMRRRASDAITHAQPTKRCARRRPLPNLAPYESALARAS